MECKGRIKDIIRDVVGGKVRLTLELDRKELDGMENLTKSDLRVKLVQWREKRSLDANAYYWVLLGQLAKVLKLSTTELHNQFLADFGQIEVIDGSVVTVVMRQDIDHRKIATIHLKPTSKIEIRDDGQAYSYYQVMRGSHTYNTAEMSVLIEGLVAEAKAQGIETATPDEIAHMLEVSKTNEKYRSS